MIKRQDISRIGKIHKPHGHSGEMSASVIPDIDLLELKFVVMDIDGILVPFMVTSSRSRGSEAVLLTLDGVESDTDASGFIGKDIYAPTVRLRELMPDDDEDDGESIGVDALIGFDVIADGENIGRISDIDDSTVNVLFVVDRPDGGTVYVPVTDDFITDIDPDERVIRMELPEGLIDL